MIADFVTETAVTKSERTEQPEILQDSNQYDMNDNTPSNPPIASGSSQKSTNRWAETPHSSTSYMMPAGVRQLQNIALLSRDSLRASSVASASVTGSQN
uniref:Uncharacterized protein n=1 Tax=Daphnia galeata TaxID=27404 RepID=A0A8J2S1J8_9CRUS|nr:unnamed protein product [Daphnia galeata]